MLRTQFCENQHDTNHKHKSARYNGMSNQLRSRVLRADRLSFCHPQCSATVIVRWPGYSYAYTAFFCLAHLALCATSWCGKSNPTSVGR
jgi:hypothetical protein